MRLGSRQMKCDETLAVLIPAPPVEEDEPAASGADRQMIEPVLGPVQVPAGVRSQRHAGDAYRMPA